MPNHPGRLYPRTAHSANEDRACFSDEVGIDFPSVAAAVERIQHAFLANGEGEARVEAQVSLTREEASRGRRVLVALPVRRTCAACGGRGETWEDACEVCLGRGESLDVHDLHVSVPPGVRDGTRVRLALSPRQAPITLIELCISVR
jgi:hypothetical protein